MRLEIFNNNNTRYIRIVESIRITDLNGNRANRKKIIANIGPVTKYDDGKANFEQRLKDSFKACCPIISELEPYILKKPLVEKYTFSISEKSPECIGHTKLYAHSLIERILEELELVRSYKGFSKVQFDLLGYLRLMIFGRILSPASKFSTVKQNDNYYEPIVKDNFPIKLFKLSELKRLKSSIIISR